MVGLVLVTLMVGLVLVTLGVGAVEPPTDGKAVGETPPQPASKLAMATRVESVRSERAHVPTFLLRWPGSQSSVLVARASFRSADAAPDPRVRNIEEL